LGKGEDAIREARRSVALAPTSGLISFCLSQVFLQTGHFDEAIGQSRRALELYPHFSGAYNNLARAYTAKGMTQEALDILQEWARYDPGPDTVQPLWTANTLARAGRKDEARRIISNWRKLRKKGLPMAYVAAVLACGDTDEALAALHQSVERHVPSMVWLKSTPELAAIRSDRRFAQELSHMRLD
jgi:predicted Zn-dependent protease